MANELTGTICNIADKVCQSVSIDVVSVPVIISLSAPDYAESAPFFFIAFSATVGIWFVAHCAGIMLNMIKRG